LTLRTWVSGTQREVSGPGSQELNARFQDLDLRTWVSGTQREDSRPDSQDLGFRPSRGFRTWVSGPQRKVSGPGSQDLGFRPSTRGFMTWISGPGFQNLESSPSYGRLIFFLSLFSAFTVTFLFPVTFLCVHCHFSFSRHFSLRPPSLFFFSSLFSASTVTFLYVQWSQTDERTN